jgi:archaellum component FlaC
MEKNKIDSQVERLQTRIEMVRTESRVLSHKIERMEQQRRVLQEEKRRLKDFMSDIVTNSIMEDNK